MRKVKELTVEVKRIIQTAPYETCTIGITETYTLDPDDDPEKQRVLAYQKIARTVSEAAERERTRYAKSKDKK